MARMPRFFLVGMFRPQTVAIGSSRMAKSENVLMAADAISAAS